MDESLLSGRSRAVLRGVATHRTGDYLFCLLRCASGRAHSGTNHPRDRWDEMMVQSIFMTRFLLLSTDRALFRLPPMRCAYHTSRRPL